MAACKLQTALLIVCPCLLLNLIAIVSVSSASPPTAMMKPPCPPPRVKPPSPPPRVKPSSPPPRVKPSSPPPRVKPPCPPPVLKPPVKSPVPKDCCYSRGNIQICINPAKPVGQCQTICNITVCSTGPGVLPAPAAAPVTTAYTGYYPVMPPPDKCCVCYRGIRFCLSTRPPTYRFPFCARDVCKKYNICFPLGRC